MTRTAIIDADWLVYAAGFVGETRQVEVTHTPSGKKRLFDNITDFWGRKKNEVGGWLGDINKSRSEAGLRPFEKEEFTHSTIRTAQPVENVLHTVKSMIKNAVEGAECDNYYGFIGAVPSWRKEIATIKEYKSSRLEQEKPLLKDEISEYLIKHHNCKYERQFEVDDRIVIESYKDRKNTCLIAVDKDALGTGCKVFDPNHPERGVIDTNCFGKLWLDDKGKVRGYGRIWLAFQWLYGDDTDTYRANCASEIKWGEKSVYESLKDCQKDEDYFKVGLDTYKMLYPEPKEIIGWKGDKIIVDYKYVADEIWKLAKMLRWEEDNVLASDVWKKYRMI